MCRRLGAGWVRLCPEGRGGGLRHLAGPRAGGLAGCRPGLSPAGPGLSGDRPPGRLPARSTTGIGRDLSGPGDLSRLWAPEHGVLNSVQ